MNEAFEGVQRARGEIAPSDLERAAAMLAAVKTQVGRVYIGPSINIEALMVALLSRGHILLEGVPGIAKTTLVKAFAEVIAASYRRVQFTPDLLPSDITGTYILDMRDNKFVLRRGPIFANIVLGDEINRAPAKTQSALLEAMQERQVTIEGVTQELPAPFMVLATQNPVEQEGVYMLPEAQLDRFLIKLTMGYPSFEDEVAVMRTHAQPTSEVDVVMTESDVKAMSELASRVHMDEELFSYIVNLVRFTREHQQTDLGASPRAAIALMKGAKSRALLKGRDYVVPDDIRALSSLVLAHRMILSPEAELNGYTGAGVVRQALESVRYGKG